MHEQKIIYCNGRMEPHMNNYVLDQTTRHDTKIDELLNILEKVFTEGSEKVVIFSQ
jgi:hypothetical protein